jgi:DNA transformation protein
VEIAAVINIGPVLADRLSAIGITTLEDLQAAGDSAIFGQLSTRFPEEACVHTRLALAGAVRGIRWHHLPAAIKAVAKEEVQSAK